MKMPLRNGDWQVLRAVLRAGPKGAAGTALRLDMSRRTKDGTFLEDLMTAGLLRRTAPTKTDVVDKDAFPPYRHRYFLTEAGTTAAEYGEFDWTPPPKKK